MGFFGGIRRVFSTGQVSSAEKARALHEQGDTEGAVKLLEAAIASRRESGKALAVLQERLDQYTQELSIERITTMEQMVSSSLFDEGHYDSLDKVLTGLDRGIAEGRFKGQAMARAEAIYKQYWPAFQELKEKVRAKKAGSILERLRRLNPETQADDFVSLAENLIRLGGRMPDDLLQAYNQAQQISYLLPETLTEFAGMKIERRLGRGGFAEVYLGSPLGTSFRQAVKVFAPMPALVRESGMSLSEMRDRFRREADLMLRLSQERIPGIVFARSVNVWQGKPYLTMDYYPANLYSLIGSDDDILKTGRPAPPLAWEKARPIIGAFLTTILAIQERMPNPIIHRDLKPGNILLDGHDRPYVGDFGLAKETSRTDIMQSLMSKTGQSLGTRFYAAPEQQGAFKEADHRADIYSAGVIIYRILTGRLLGLHDYEQTGLSNPSTPKELDDLLRKATMTEVDQRLSDVKTLLSIFEGDVRPIEVQSSPAGPRPEELFQSALEMAYAFAAEGGILPDPVRAKLAARASELGLDAAAVVTLEEDYRRRLGLAGSGGERVVSASAALGSGAAAGFGALVITSEPEMAEVTIDGIARGKTPLSIARTEAGRRSVWIKLPGYYPVRRLEQIQADRELKIHVILEPQLGSIKVEAKTYSAKYPARFFLDGKLMGPAPLTVQDVVAGEHTWRVEADQHAPATGPIEVKLDEEAQVSATLIPVPGRIEVVSVPEMAELIIDEKDTGDKTDTVIEMDAGRHKVSVKLKGYKQAEKEIELEPGGYAQAEFRLEKGGIIEV